VTGAPGGGVRGGAGGGPLSTAGPAPAHPLQRHAEATRAQGEDRRADPIPVRKAKTRARRADLFGLGSVATAGRGIPDGDTAAPAATAAGATTPRGGTRPPAATETSPGPAGVSG